MTSNILLTAVGISVSSLVALVFVLNSIVTESMNIRDIQISEHADEAEIVPPGVLSTDGGDIITVAYWKKDTVTISFFPRDMNQSESREIIGHLKDLMRIAKTNSSLSNYTGWQYVLSDLSQNSDYAPSLKILKDGDDTADIKVFVEGSRHPEDKLGYAWVSRDGNTGEIISVEISIFSSSPIFEEGIIGALFTHELGHALGLGHASSIESIMHNRIVIVNDEVIGKIRDCETDAMHSLYEQRLIRDIKC